MSKQSEAKAAQNYQAKGPTCATCVNLQSDQVMQAWQREQNESLVKIGHAPRWNIEEHGLEKNTRCGIGGFAIKKHGCCDMHRVRP